MKMDNSPARGMRDLLPQAVSQRARVLASIIETYEKYEFQQIETPAVESIEKLTAGSSGSENQKLIFQILKRGLDPEIEPGTLLADLVDSGLRFDLTVPLARYYANNQAKLRTPFRALQVGPVWRAERPQKGRFRQFVQCDIDIIGEPTVLAEIELIAATSEAISKLLIESKRDGGVTVFVSDRRLLNAIADETKIDEVSRNKFFVTLDKRDKIGEEGIREELLKLGIGDEQIDRVEDIMANLFEPDDLAKATSTLLPGLDKKVVRDLITVLETFDDRDTCKAILDPALVRGMGYYTGQIFEVRDNTLGLSVAGGGRYDNLIGTYSNVEVPACGFSIGFERIMEFLGGQTVKEGVAVIFEDGDVSKNIARAAETYREQGLSVSLVKSTVARKAQLQKLSDLGFESYVYLGNSYDPLTPPEINKLD